MRFTIRQRELIDIINPILHLLIIATTDVL